MESQKAKSVAAAGYFNEDEIRFLREMSYKDLWGICKARVSISYQAADEIRRRRTMQALPYIENNCGEDSLNPWQKKIFGWLKKSLPRQAQLILTTQYIKGGWVVYLTGQDEEVIKTKIALICKGVREEIKEFGSCRVIVIPYSKFPGLKISYDKGLRCPYPIKWNEARKEGGG